jgi:hypothetical protein
MADVKTKDVQYPDLALSSFAERAHLQTNVPLQIIRVFIAKVVTHLRCKSFIGKPFIY